MSWLWLQAWSWGGADCGIAYAAGSGTYEPLTVRSGFNADVVATSRDSSTDESYAGTDALDAVAKARTKACFYSETADQETGFLPADGKIASIDGGTAGLNWQLGSYTEANALRLSSGESGTLEFNKVGCYEEVYFLCVAGGLGSGHSAAMNATVYYSDGTSAAGSFTVWDWYDQNSVASDLYKRLDAGSVDGSDAGAPYMTQCVMPTDSTKLIKRIEVSSQNSGMTLSILGVTGRTSGTPAPVATAASEVQQASFTANWSAVEGAEGYVLDVSTTEDFSGILPEYNNKNVGNVTSFAVSGLSGAETCYYRVRAFIGNAFSASSNTVAVGGSQAGGNDVSDGNIKVDTVVGENAPQTYIYSSIDLKEVVLTPEEKEQVQNGAAARIYVRVENINDTVSDSDAALVTSCTDAAIGQYLDISMFKSIMNNDIRVTEIDGRLKFVIEIPENLINQDTSKNRTYYMIRIHNGSAQIIDTVFNSASRELTFYVDGFSTFAIAYKDSDVPSGADGSDHKASSETDKPAPAAVSPKTGDPSVMPWALLAVTAGVGSAAGIYMTGRTKKKSCVKRLAGQLKSK